MPQVLTRVWSAGTLLLAVAVLVATATTDDRALPRLDRLRIVGAASASLLVAGSVASIVSGFALAVACLALLLSVHSIWLAMRHQPPLVAYLERLTSGRDAAWRDDFERPFRDYVRESRAAASGRATRRDRRRPTHGAPRNS